MEIVKSFGIIIGVFILGVLIDEFREVTNIPVTVLDIILFPLSIAGIFTGLRLLFSKKRNHVSTGMSEQISTQSLLVSFVIFLFILLLGLCSLWSGISEPLMFMPGAKGSLHGYTLIA